MESVVRMTMVTAEVRRVGSADCVMLVNTAYSATWIGNYIFYVITIHTYSAHCCRAAIARAVRNAVMRLVVRFGYLYDCAATCALTAFMHIDTVIRVVIPAIGCIT